jgi:hypothetical protein
MPSKNSGQRLRDILENLDAIQAFTAGIDFAAFAADRKTVLLSRAPSRSYRKHLEDWAELEP